MAPVACRTARHRRRLVLLATTPFREAVEAGYIFVPQPPCLQPNRAVRGRNLQKIPKRPICPTYPSHRPPGAARKGIAARRAPHLRGPPHTLKQRPRHRSKRGTVRVAAAKRKRLNPSSDPQNNTSLFPK